jgi:hypothetical protein
MSSTIIIKQDEMKSSYDSDEEIDKIKQNSNKISVRTKTIFHFFYIKHCFSLFSLLLYHL